LNPEFKRVWVPLLIHDQGMDFYKEAISFKLRDYNGFYDVPNAYLEEVADTIRTHHFLRSGEHLSQVKIQVRKGAEMNFVRVYNSVLG